MRSEASATIRALGDFDVSRQRHILSAGRSKKRSSNTYSLLFSAMCIVKLIAHSVELQGENVQILYHFQPMLPVPVRESALPHFGIQPTLALQTELEVYYYVFQWIIAKL